MGNNFDDSVDAVIREKDLISFDGSILDLCKKLGNLQKTIENVADAISAKAPYIRKNIELMANGGGIQLDFWDKVRAAAKNVDSLYDAQIKLAASMTDTANTIALANEAMSKNVQSTKLWAKETLAADGSIDELSAKLKRYVNEWTALSEVERNGIAGEQIINNIVKEQSEISRLNAVVKVRLTQAKQLQEVKARVAIQSGNEAQQLSELRQELNEVNRIRELEVKAANSAVGSYNRLAAEYELGKLRLKGMAHATQDQIDLFELESKRLADLYKQMMDMQEATGKHTLSVGDYGKAFRSLSTETAMLVRELPALAVSANTFFLAISNNLPMFMSAVTRMKKENKALEAMGQQTTSVFKTIMKSALSWQTLVITALFLLSKYGDKIFEWIKNIFKRTVDATNAMKAFSAQMGILGEAHKEVAKNTIELDLIIDRLKLCKKGTKEWKDGVAAVNAITKRNLDDTTATIDSIEKITEAYKNQALQLAINEEVVKRLSENAIQESGIAQSALPVTENEMFRLLPDKFYKEGKEVNLSDKDRKYLYEFHEAVLQEWQKIIANTNNIDWTTIGAETIEDFRRKLAQGKYADKLSTASQILQERTKLAMAETSKNAAVTIPALKRATEEVRNHQVALYRLQGQLGDLAPLFEAIAEQNKKLREYWPKMSQTEIDAITSMYDIEELLKKNKKKTAHTYTRQFIFDPWYEAKKRAEALTTIGSTELETIKLWEDKKLAVELAAYGEARDNRKKYWDKQLEKLKADLAHGLVTRQQYAEYEIAIERQKNLDLEALDAKHNADALKIQQEAADKSTKLFIKQYNDKVNAVENQLKGITNPEKAKELLRQLNMYVGEIETARDAEWQSSESAEAYRKALDNLQKQISSATSAIVKMNVEQVKAETRLSKFGRAASSIGNKRNFKIAADNVNALAESIKKLRKQLVELNPRSANYETDKALIQKQIDSYIQQMQSSINRINVQGMVGNDSGIVEGMIDSIIDAADPGYLLEKLKSFGFGDVVKTYLEDAMSEVDDKALVDAFNSALIDNENDILAAIQSLEPDMREKIKQILSNIGLKAGDDLASLFKKAWNVTKQWFNQTIGYLTELAQAYTDLAEAKAEAAAEATDIAKDEYEKEKALLEAGYANAVETKWAEYIEKKAIQDKAEADAKKAAQVQQDIESAQQLMSLMSAAANIMKYVSGIPGVGVPLAISMIGIMFAAFKAAKVKAREAAKYGEGHAELITGGSHASGHDSPLAYDSKGRERRVEGGEVVGIFRRRAVADIGASRLIRNIDNINRGRYVDLAKSTISRDANLHIMNQSIQANSVDLSALEKGVSTIASQSLNRVYVDAAGNTIYETPSSKTIIRRAK